MKIGVVSDTHSQELPQQMLDDFKDVDFIVHAGDICSPAALAQLEKIRPVKAVYGNMDSHDIRASLPQREILRCGNFSLGIFHGDGAPARLLETVRAHFKDVKVDAIIFGHSHHPLNERIDGTLFFNPGSPTDTVFAPYRSYGILEINDEITGRIVKVR
jgi:putative phosphoesterase